jgi:hypothetical protein
MLGNPQGSISPFVAVRFVRSKNENARFVFESAPDKISAQPQKTSNLSNGIVAFNELGCRWALVGCELFGVRFHSTLLYQYALHLWSSFSLLKRPFSWVPLL